MGGNRFLETIIYKYLYSKYIYIYIIIYIRLLDNNASCLLAVKLAQFNFLIRICMPYELMITSSFNRYVYVLYNIRHPCVVYLRDYCLGPIGRVLAIYYSLLCEVTTEKHTT